MQFGRFCFLFILAAGSTCLGCSWGNEYIDNNYAEDKSENSLDVCQDEEDNDEDGYTDCDDQDCFALTVCEKEGTDSASDSDADGGVENDAD